MQGHRERDRPAFKALAGLAQQTQTGCVMTRFRQEAADRVARVRQLAGAWGVLGNPPRQRRGQRRRLVVAAELGLDEGPSGVGLATARAADDLEGHVRLEVGQVRPQTLEVLLGRQAPDELVPLRALRPQRLGRRRRQPGRVQLDAVSLNETAGALHGRRCCVWRVSERVRRGTARRLQTASAALHVGLVFASATRAGLGGVKSQTLGSPTLPAPHAE